MKIKRESVVIWILGMIVLGFSLPSAGVRGRDSGSAA